MNAVILAAGQGSRLLPHTARIPKCLLKIGGRAILDYQIAALRHHGIDDITIVVGHGADRIREHVTVPVRFVQNNEYQSTGSNYSLWLARDCIRDGFIYLNSDLVFHPDMLRILLQARDCNAIVIDREVNPVSDMFKAEMIQSRILRVAKQLATGAAEIVGPAKFCASGSGKIRDRLEHLVSAGNRNAWVYQVFGDLAAELELAGVDNPGCFWAEIDTPRDAADANARIPQELIDFADESVSAPAESPRRETPTVNRRHTATALSRARAYGCIDR